MRRPKYRLSPNEVERLVKEDREQRRKLRIIQVREQAKASAAAIRNDVRRAKEKLLQDFATEVKDQLEAEKEEKIRKMEQAYENTLRTVGEAHREAFIHGDGESRSEQLARQRENEMAAQWRYKEALERQRVEDAQKEYEQNKHILARQAALEREKERAAEIAALPPPPPDISVELEKHKKRAIPMTDMQAFATTHYHIPEYHVIRADDDQQLYDAKAQAKDSDLKLQQDLAEKKRSQHEQIERARIRGNQALQKEMLKHDLGDMLKDLSLLQKQDRRRRQAVLADIPKQVFIPPERCLEEREERQREMERKFDEMYMKQYRLENEELRSYDISDYPTTQDSVDGSGQESSTTPDVPIPMSRINPALRDLTNVQRQEEEGQGDKPETVLKQLLNRIKEQRVNTLPGQSGQPVTSASLRVVSEADSQSLVSAGSRADWQRSQQEEFSGLVSRYPLSDQGQGDREFSSAGQSADVRGDKGSDLDSAAISANDHMIEELKHRIRMIESEKERLAQQFRAQTSFHRHLMEEHQLQGQEGKSEEDTTLREVDIETTQNSEIDHSMDRSKERDIRVRVLPSEDVSPSVDLAEAASNLKPVTGILKGVGNTQYELLTSNGFLPAPEMTTVQQQMAQLQPDRLMSDTRERDDGYKDFPAQSESVRSLDMADIRCRISAGGARREINFGVEPTASLPTFVGVESRRFDGGDFRLVSGQTSDLHHHSLTSSLGGTGDGQSEADQLMRRVREYGERAGKRQAGVDAETLQKVREYQQRLLETHEERKKLLAEVRADIEYRRQELYTTVSRPPWPAVSLESRSDKLASIDSWTGLRARSALTSLGINHSGETMQHKDWEPIQPFIADPGGTASGPRMAGLTQTGMVSLTDESGQRISQPGGLTTQPAVSEREVKPPGAEDRLKVDKIRKSLSFEDAEESMNASHLSWKDALNDTATSKCSHATTDNSKLTSSEEERGSPLLTHTRSSKSELSDKSGNSVTGSSSLNGSALVARAEERRMGFERRQEELQQQLMDIQQQKDTILQRYYAGQKALQQQQVALRSKLATASSTSSSAKGDMQRAQMRAKLADVNSQIGTGDGESANWLYGRGNVSGLTAAGDDTDMTTRARNSHNESRDSEAASARLSSGSMGTPGNLSTDSYLAEISYHKIKSGDVKSLSTSAFEARGVGSTSLFSLPTATSTGTSCGLQTWASLLTSTASSKPREDGSSSQDSSGQNEGSARWYRTRSSQEDTQSSGDKSWSSDVVDDVQDQIRESPSHATPPPLSVHSAAATLADHQPHELSTILEVDTPSSSSAVPSVRRTLPTAQGSVAPTISSQSLSSVGSSSDTRSDIRMDVFQTLPYTFPESKAAAGAPGGAIYDLTTKGAARWEDYLRGESKPPAETADAKQTRAKRSLDFSEQLQVTEVEPTYEYLSSEEDLFATAMPALVELTPLKQPLRGEPDSHAHPHVALSSVAEVSMTSDNSSLAISGYSDYLRHKENKPDSEGKGENQSLSAELTMSDLSAAGGGGQGGEGNSHSGRLSEQEQKISQVLQQAREFDPDLMSRLRQQSHSVFSDNTGGTTGVSGGQSSGVLSGLEEVSITDTTQGTEGEGEE